MNLMDYAKSYARTVIPYVVGLVVAFAARHGVKLDAQETAALSFGVGTVYYALARLGERYVTPKFGWLLGLPQQPVYAKVRTCKDMPSPSKKTSHIGSLIADAVTAVPVRTVVVPEKKIAGKRLGRHIHHDERSRAYRVTPHPAPRSVTWHRHVKPFDQGDLGSCTGNAMAGALSTAPFNHRFTETRAVKLYEQATSLDDVPGQYPPDDTGSSGLAVAKAAQQDGYITSYLHCFTLDDVISALQDGPVIAGTNWHTGMDNPDANGYVHATGSVRGGHEYELVGVDLDAKYLLACNSWGTSWGPLGGYFKIPFADFTRLLTEQGDVTVPIR